MITTSLKMPLGIIDVPKQKNVCQLRWPLIIGCSYLLLFPRDPWLSPAIMAGLILLYVLTNVALYYLPESLFDKRNLFSPIVILDTLFISLSLAVSGQIESDFYLTYLLIIFISTFWQDLRCTVGFGLLIASVYSVLVFFSGEFQPSLFLRPAFLFAASVFYGYVTHIVGAEIALRANAEANAKSDFLTGLPNRRAFEERLGEEFDRVVRYKRPLSLLMMDVDNFKSINDTFGHPTGDEVLKEIAARLRREIRKSDFPCRYGGEEFTVILPETKAPNALVAARRIRQSVQSMVFETKAGPYTVTVSIGVSSTSEKDYPVYQDLVKDADQALYRAKKNGKDREEMFCRESSWQTASENP